jgi:hypothetical protein
MSPLRFQVLVVDSQLLIGFPLLVQPLPSHLSKSHSPSDSGKPISTTNDLSSSNDPLALDFCAEGSGGKRGSSFSGELWSSLVWSGLVWSGLVWSGLVWSGLVWCMPTPIRSPIRSPIFSPFPSLSGTVFSAIRLLQVERFPVDVVGLHRQFIITPRPERRGIDDDVGRYAVTAPKSLWKGRCLGDGSTVHLLAAKRVQEEPRGNLIV